MRRNPFAWLAAALILILVVIFVAINWNWFADRLRIDDDPVVVTPAPATVVVDPAAPTPTVVAPGPTITTGELALLRESIQDLVATLRAENAALGTQVETLRTQLTGTVTRIDAAIAYNEDLVARLGTQNDLIVALNAEVEDMRAWKEEVMQALQRLEDETLTPEELRTIIDDIRRMVDTNTPAPVAQPLLAPTVEPPAAAMEVMPRGVTVNIEGDAHDVNICIALENGDGDAINNCYEEVNVPLPVPRPDYTPPPAPTPPVVAPAPAPTPPVVVARAAAPAPAVAPTQCQVSFRVTNLPRNSSNHFFVLQAGGGSVGFYESATVTINANGTYAFSVPCSVAQAEWVRICVDNGTVNAHVLPFSPPALQNLRQMRATGATNLNAQNPLVFNWD